ncbi:MAG: DsrE family protein [Deltaproteobacteria bacterium]|nr:DsrE family protein [Deltaproteobacteria bacterium]
MQVLIVLNDPPYGTERTYNGLRLALNLLQKVEGASVTAFLMGDAAAAAKAGQQTPNGYYNIERMLKGVLTRKGEVLLCGTCMDARGIKETEIVGGSRRSTLDELTSLTATADKVLVF